MRLMFAYFIAEDAGSAQDIQQYTRVAKELGHEVKLYGWPGALPSFDFERDVEWADAVIFIFEWTTQLRFGDQLDLARIVGKVPRARRFVIDCDGAYNDVVRAGADYNHRDAESARRWVETCDSLSDRIYQPTLHPLRKNVGTFFFHAYNPAWEVPLDFRGKEYGMVYVGNNWFRWRALERVLRAVEPVRERVGRIGLVGHGWDTPAPWAKPTITADAYRTDSQYLRRLGVEVTPPVRFDQVVGWMSKGVMTPVIYRPLFDHLRLVTCRTFETPAANVIPLFAQDEEFVREIYGAEAAQLVLPTEQPQDRIRDVLERPERYAGIVRGIRRYLAEKHSYAARLRELIAIVES